MSAEQNAGQNAGQITADTFPKQGEWLNRRIQVCFHYDTNRILMGTIIRDDAEAPFKTIIRLDDGRVVLSTECMYTRVEIEP